MQIALAPMEGLVDDIMRDILTRVGGIDWCVTEFIRVCDRVLPEATFHKMASELAQGSRTPAGVPMRVQLLGSDPECLADNAALACELGAPVIDLKFGCPAKTVNKSRGGAVLLKEPELLFRIVSAVRKAVPAHIPVTSKMRLGFETPDGALDCARALAEGGSAHLVVHARTKVEGYKPPAHWEWVAKVQDVVKVPVFANGEVWTLDDWRRCREVSGVKDIMLGRGLVSRPDLARQIAAVRDGVDFEPMDWVALMPLIQDFWRRVRVELTPRSAPGRLKQWLAMLTRSYPEATALFTAVRRETDCDQIGRLLGVEPLVAAA